MLRFTVKFVVGLFCIGLFVVSLLSGYCGKLNNEFTVVLAPFFVPLIITNILVALALIFFKTKLAIIPCLAVLLNFHIIPSFVQFPSFNSNDTNETNNTNDICIQTYNVHNFRYDTYKNTANNILQAAVENTSDIICLQEFAGRNNINILKKHYPYYCISNPKNSSGLAIFSKYPIIKHNKIFSSANTQKAIYADIRIKGKTVRVINVHLQTTGISQKVDEINTITDNVTTYEKKEKAFWNVVRTYISNSGLRKQQTDILHQEIKEINLPLIVCGDFNSLPNSYTYNNLTQSLKDSFKESGCGYAYSFHQYKMIRLDYIFINEKINANNFYYKYYSWSDHNPAFLKFSI